MRAEIEQKLAQIKAGTAKVVVSLFQGERQVEYSECTLAEAAEMLDRKTVNGFRYGIPTWQFDESGGTPALELSDAAREAYRLVRLSQ